MAMQDIRLRLEPQLSTVTATFTSSSSSSSASASSSSASSSSSNTAETTLIETAQKSPVATEQIFSEAAAGAGTTNTSPQHYFHHHHHHPHQHPQRPQSQSHTHSHPHPHHPRRHVEQLQLVHSHHNAQELPEQEHQHQLQLPRSPSSEEDNSPTEMNNCRRLVDKPPLVKRLTMGIGLLRGTEDSRPLVHNTCGSSLNSGSSQTISDGYVNEAICEPDKYVASKFGDSCRQSLTALETATQRLQVELPGNKKYLRETCSANSSPKLFAGNGSLRLDNLSLAEQQELKGAAWFQAGIPREISLEVLSRQSPGAFLVRQSSTKPGCFALSLRVPPPSPRVAHYLILRTQRGYKIKGFTKEFSSLKALITHHSVMPELLPVPLTLPRPAHVRSHAQAQVYGSGSGGGGGDFEMYGSLNDFRNMMADLNV
ncbi:uncharacterized protein Egfrap [Drosophila pseudoobscura]|uniref:Uncharacterized protein Egfrap n=1 Tax=Drosophila pseudoobscura pseudoobscura TaxID=46245 RepID=A0A6I8V0T8_DROPS|nr:uncharacterized protein LOC6900728 [Drosophila pseudoobscura]XP_033239166.1 uncharacterized protein LOC6900728 [Drosophila pseudoobscura]